MESRITHYESLFPKLNISLQNNNKAAWKLSQTLWHLKICEFIFLRGVVENCKHLCKLLCPTEWLEKDNKLNLKKVSIFSLC